MLEVKLLGKFEVKSNDQPVEIPLRAAQSLLAYLMLNAGTPHRREQLAGLFWPDMPDANAKSNLRQALSRLRKAIGEQYLRVDELTIAFDATADYWLDAQVLARKVGASTSTADLIEVVSAYRGELLLGFYDEWVLLERERLQVAFERKMTLLLDQLIETQRWDEVLEWSDRWISLGHTPEAAYRALISAYGARGDVSNATLAYRRCEEALRRELGVDPSPQTLAALERARREAAVPIDLPVFQRPRANLPAALTSFIGREKEVAEVRRLITTQRTVTLTGSGGAGKTRLALEAASGLIDHFADGVWLIEFAPLNDTALVPYAVASTLGLQDTGGRPIIMALIEVLREKHRLLIFDNCEHLIDACTQLAAALLQACPQLHILSTSRERLDIPGEMPFRVPPLNTPDAQHPPIIQELEHYEAVQLFVERGVAAVPAYALTANNAAAIARICQRLDGMPLAIELAAARLKTLRAKELAARLDDRFHLLTGGSRAALPRQQTLRATIDWSYNLLSRPEQMLLQRLSVFAGSWTLEAAQSVCGESSPSPLPSPSILTSLGAPREGEGVSSALAHAGRGVAEGPALLAGVGEAYDVLDLLTHLADKSLINIERAQGQETRFRMLETIRQYAHEKLIASGEEAALHQRHLDYYMQLAERAEPELVSFDQFAWRDRLETEFDNMRAALEWSLTIDAESGLRLASSLRWFWCHGTHVDESSEFLARLLQLSTPQAIALVIRAKALAVLAELMYWRNEQAQAEQLAEESLALCRTIGDAQGETLALLELARALWSQGRASETHHLYDQCLALSRAHNDPIRTAEALLWIGTKEEGFEESLAIFRTHGHGLGAIDALNEMTVLAIFKGDYRLARRRLSESIRHTRRAAASTAILAYQMHLSARIAWREGDYARAQDELEESVQLSQESGHHINACWALSDLGYVLLRQGDFERSRQIWKRGLHDFREANFPIGIVFNIEGLASLAVQQGQPARAARLLAWADATRQAIEDTRPPVEQADVDRDLAIIHTQLDDDTFQAEQEAGRKMTMDEAIAYALSEEVVN